MHPSNSSNDNSNQFSNRFETELPPLPPFSPLMLGSPHTLPSLEYPCDTFSELTTCERAQDTSTHNHGDNVEDGHHAVKTSKDEQATISASACQDPSSTMARNMDSEITSIFHESISAMFDLPPLQDVGAFHAHAHIVEVPAPSMQRGISHRAEIISTTETDNENRNPPTTPSPNLIIDLDCFSFFSSQQDSELLSPSWQLELTLPSSWHLAAESAKSLSQPPWPQGSNLVRRPATRRKCVVDPNTPHVPIRKSPHLNGSRTSMDLSRKRLSTAGIASESDISSESGILRTMDSPLLKSRGYRVRFETMEKQ